MTDVIKSTELQGFEVGKSTCPNDQEYITTLEGTDLCVSRSRQAEGNHLELVHRRRAEALLKFSGS